MTEIKFSIFGRVWLLKNFFFECLYFSEYNIRMFYLFFGFLVGHPLSTHATGGMDGVIQNAYRCLQWEGSSKIGHKIRTYKMDVVEYFLCISSGASPPARKMSLFSPIIVTNILSYAIIRI